MFRQQQSALGATEGLVVYRKPGLCRRLAFRAEDAAQAVGKLTLSALREMLSLLARILKGLFNFRVLFRMMTDLLVIACVSFCLACFCAMKEGGFDLYMSSFLPFLGVLAVFTLVTETLRSSRMFLFTVSLLILTGTALQTLLKLPAPQDVSPSNTGLVLYAAVSVAFAFLALPALNALVRAENRDSSIQLLNALVFLLYAALLLFGRRVNGTRAWIYLGPVSLQLTEMTKALTLILFGLEFTNEEDAPEKRLRRGVLTFLMNAFFLLIVNEFGALCVILAGFALTAFLYLPSLWKLFRTAFLLGVVLASMILACFLCHNLRANARERNPDAVIHPAIAQGARIYDKFQLRMDILFRPESVDKNDGGYQSARAKNAIILSDWFGSSYEVYIPVVESDYIFDYLLLRMGVMFGVLSLLLMLFLFLNATLLCLRNPHAAEGAVGVTLAFSISFQSILAAASATGQFLTVGIPFAFLAYGGTSTLVNYTMVMYILYAMRRDFAADKADGISGRFARQRIRRRRV